MIVQFMVRFKHRVNKVNNSSEIDRVVPVHPVLGHLGGEPGAQPVVGVRGRVLVGLELTELTAIVILKPFQQGTSTCSWF